MRSALDEGPLVCMRMRHDGGLRPGDGRIWYVHEQPTTAQFGGLLVLWYGAPEDGLRASGRWADRPERFYQRLTGTE